MGEDEGFGKGGLFAAGAPRPSGRMLPVKSFFPVFSIVLGLAGCASSSATSSSAGADRGAEGAASVSTSTGRTARPVASEEGTGRSDAPGAAAGASPGARPRRNEEEESAHARRLRVIDEASSDEKPAGASEARMEPDGEFILVPGGVKGVALFPRYSLRGVEKKDGGSPAESVLRYVPGPKVELPEPEKPKEPKARPAAETPVEPGAVLPKEAR